VVSEDVGEVSMLESSELRIYLVALKGLLEVNGYLCCDFGKNFCSHIGVTRFLEEEILGLCEAKVAVHAQCLLVEVSGTLSWWKL